jgi:hypothetical protein
MAYFWEHALLPTMFAVRPNGEGMMLLVGGGF